MIENLVRSILVWGKEIKSYEFSWPNVAILKFLCDVGIVWLAFYVLIYTLRELLTFDIDYILPCMVTFLSDVMRLIVTTEVENDIMNTFAMNK